MLFRTAHSETKEISFKLKKGIFNKGNFPAVQKRKEKRRALMTSLVKKNGGDPGNRSFIEIRFTNGIERKTFRNNHEQFVQLK